MFNTCEIDQESKNIQHAPQAISNLQRFTIFNFQQKKSQISQQSYRFGNPIVEVTGIRSVQFNSKTITITNDLNWC